MKEGYYDYMKLFLRLMGNIFFDEQLHVGSIFYEMLHFENLVDSMASVISTAKKSESAS